MSQPRKRPLSLAGSSVLEVLAAPPQKRSSMGTPSHKSTAAASQKTKASPEEEEAKESDLFCQPVDKESLSLSEDDDIIYMPTRRKQAITASAATKKKDDDWLKSSSSSEDDDDNDDSPENLDYAKPRAAKPSPSKGQAASFGKKKPTKSPLKTKKELIVNPLLKEPYEPQVMQGKGATFLHSSLHLYAVDVLTSEAARVKQDVVGRYNSNTSMYKQFVKKRVHKELLQKTRQALRTTHVPGHYAPCFDIQMSSIAQSNERRTVENEKLQSMIGKLDEQHRRLEKQLADELKQLEDLRSKLDGVTGSHHPVVDQCMSERRMTNEVSASQARFVRPAPKGSMALLLQRMAHETTTTSAL